MVNFNEETHTYTLDNKELISVTQLLKLAGVSTDYSFVNNEVMKKASERGTLIHKEIEDYIKNGEVGFTEELFAFIDYLKENDLEPIASELLVNDDEVAGTIDLILKNRKTGEIILADIKTTYSVNKDYVSWQTSLYKHLYGEQVDKLQCLHLKGDKLKAIELIKKTPEQIASLYQLLKDGTMIKNSLVGVETELAELYETEKLIQAIEQQKKEVEETAKEMRSAIVEKMKEQGLTKFENDKIIISYIAPTTAQIVDSKKLKEEYPETYEKVLKESVKSEQVRIKLKE
jgi:hypothetical protein